MSSHPAWEIKDSALAADMELAEDFSESLGFLICTLLKPEDSKEQVCMLDEQVLRP